ncbi:hypothetical protein DFJ74DRAFT_701232 [Hyaloraphidium curvatum]|nr:hypothetical protein DFJ74DRAFT_701232 [Hyaloraphidium curvatum]
MPRIAPPALFLLLPALFLFLSVRFPARGLSFALPPAPRRAGAARGTLRVCRWLPPPSPPWKGRNFGDELGPAVVSLLLARLAPGVRVVDAAATDVSHSAHREKCLWAVGTVFSRVKSGDAVWGAGAFVDPRPSQCPPAGARVFAVRGPLTRKWLRETCNRTEPAVYGDPAVLLPLLDPGLRGNRGEGWCAVPHGGSTADLMQEEVRRFQERTNNASNASVRFVDPRRPWRDVVLDIAGCGAVASASLHGIVIAESLGIRVRFVKYKEVVVEGDKYADYYASTGREGEAAARDLGEAVRMGGRGPPVAGMPDQWELLQAFPWDYVLDELLIPLEGEG